MNNVQWTRPNNSHLHICAKDKNFTSINTIIIPYTCMCTLRQISLHIAAQSSNSHFYIFDNTNSDLHINICTHASNFNCQVGIYAIGNNLHFQI